MRFPTQSTFVPERLITNNVILGFECIHAINNRSGKEWYLAMKLDMSKTYNRVEWSFLHMVMEKMGFEEGWINKIMNTWNP